MRHAHDSWELVSANWSPPRTVTKSVEGQSYDMVLKLTYGITTVTQRCTSCGRHESYIVAGDARTPKPDPSTDRHTSFQEGP